MQGSDTAPYDKYVLLVKCEHDDPHHMEIPLMLDGSESLEQAVARFKDAVAVAKQGMMQHHGRQCLTTDRIDGIPTIKQAALHKHMSETYLNRP